MTYNAPCGSMTLSPGAFANFSEINRAFVFNTSTTLSKNSCGVFRISGNAC